MALPRRSIQVLTLLLAGLCPDRTFPAGDEGFALSIPEVKTSPGESFRAPVLVDAPVPYQGFSFTVAYPPAALEALGIGVEGTILEAIGSDFVHGTVLPDLGLIILAVLVDAAPPFDGALAPAVGMPLEIAGITGRVSPGAPDRIPLEFVRQAQRPAAPAIFSVENLPVAARSLKDGAVILTAPPMRPAFIRGDANTDGQVDIADPAFILQWQFLGDRRPRCEAAADVNSDTVLDVSDAVDLLNFIFLGGPRPFPPQGRPGPDILRNPILGCAEPLIWIPAGR